MTTRSGWLGRRYAEHNRVRGRGFLYGGEQRVGALAAYLPPDPNRVLDLGCRDGALARALTLDHVFGVDIDMEALRDAKGSVRPLCVDLWSPTLPFRSDAFDVVLAGEVIEHVPFPEMLVSESARVLRSGGAFVGSVPNAFRLKNRLLFLAGRSFEVDPTHLRQFSPQALRSLLRRYFRDVTLRPCVGRWAKLWPRMMGNDLVFRARSPG